MHNCCNVSYRHCSFPAFSLRNGRCMEEGDTKSGFFLYNIHIFVPFFSNVSIYYYSSALASQPGSDRTFPLVVILVTQCDCYRPMLMDSMMAPGEWRRISQCSTCTKHQLSSWLDKFTTDWVPKNHRYLRRPYKRLPGIFIITIFTQADHSYYTHITHNIVLHHPPFPKLISPKHHSSRLNLPNRLLWEF